MVLKKEALFAIKPVLWLPHPVGLGLFFFFFLLFFWFSYGDYSFGRALKTTVGRGEGEAAGLKDMIKQGGGVKQCIKDGETERRRC